METKLMLHVLICEKIYFNLDLSFSYGKTEAKNKPPEPLDIHHHSSGGSKLPLSGEYHIRVLCVN